MEKELEQEQRILPQELSDVRAIQGEDGVWHIPGRAIVFNSRSKDITFFKEIIDPKALDNANLDDAISTFNHNMTYILGTVRNKTTSYVITPEGLDYDTLPPDNPTIRDIVMAPIIRRDITGSSFIFKARKKGGDAWYKEPDGTIIRRVLQIETVFEWGPVSIAAYGLATAYIAKRSFDDFISHTHEMENLYKINHAKRRLSLLR